MNKDEKLKIYSAYLPYQTKCYCMGEQDEDGKPIMFEINGFTHDLVEVLECNTTNITHFDYDEIFPILYNLSYLTKEIEHEGETFVPMAKLEQLFGIGFKKFNNTLGFSYFFKGLSNGVLFDKIEGFRNKLLEWHFNVFNIPEGKYINKATLTNK